MLFYVLGQRSWFVVVALNQASTMADDSGHHARGFWAAATANQISKVLEYI